MLATYFLWIGLTLVVATPPFNLGTAQRVLQIAGAIGMVIGCVLLVLGR